MLRVSKKKNIYKNLANQEEEEKKNAFFLDVVLRKRNKKIIPNARKPEPNRVMMGKNTTEK